MAYFSPDFTIIDTANQNGIEQIVQPDTETIAKIHDALVLGISDYFRKTGFKTATLGLSGGIDSAVTLVLAAEALGSRTIFRCC
jgi:NAD+ synthase (glutamine-hydrolysing)